MSIKRGLKWLAIAVAMVLVLVILYLTFGDLGWVGGKVEAMVFEATGRRLDLGGEFEIEALWSPSIVAENVTFTNADWGSEPLLAEVGHLSARVDLWSLISGPILVEEVRLRDVRVLLETNEKGVSNLDMGTAEAEPEAPPAERDGEVEIPLVVEFAEIRNIELVIRRPEAEDQVVTVESLDLAANEDLHLQLDGNGKLNEYDWLMGGTVGPFGAVKRGDAIELALAGSVGNLNLEIDGHIGTVKALKGTDLDIHVASEDIVPLLETLDVPLAITGALRIDTNLQAEGDASTLVASLMLGEIRAEIEADLTPSEIDFEATVSELDKIGAALKMEGLPALPLTLAGGVTLGEKAVELREVTAKVGEFEARMSGSLATSPEGVTDLSASASGPTLANVSPSLPDIPFDLEAGIVRSTEKTTLDPFSMTIGESHVTAALEITQGEALSVTGKLQSETLDLSPFLPEPVVDEGAETAQLEEFEEGDEPWEEGETSEFVFTEDPLPFDQLGKQRVDLKLDIGEFILGPVGALDVRADVTLNESGVRFDGGFKSPVGGEVDADIELITEGETGELSVTIYARDLRPTILSEGLDDSSQVPPLDITVELEAVGASARAMAESADGRILVTMSKGLVSNSALGFVSGDLLGALVGALNPFAKDDPFSTQDCAIISVTMEEGMADIGTMYIQGEKVTIVGNGDVDLATEKLHLEFNTKPREGIGISADMFVTPFVKLGGTLAAPRIGLSKSGALLSGGVAVLTGGLSVLVKGATDRLSGGMDHCEARLADTGGHPPIGAAEDPSPPIE